jgi:hypothetical protein
MEERNGHNTQEQWTSLPASWYKLKGGRRNNLNLLYKQKCYFLSDLDYFSSPADNSISLLLSRSRYLSISHQDSCTLKPLRSLIAQDYGARICQQAAAGL